MIKQSTVFVLGAGASQPYGFPLGAALVDQVGAEIIDSREGLLQRLADGMAFSPGECLEFAQALRDARPYLIDAFLEMRSDYRDIGKAAIADVSFRAEIQPKRIG